MANFVVDGILDFHIAVEVPRVSAAIHVAVGAVGDNQLIPLLRGNAGDIHTGIVRPSVNTAPERRPDGLTVIADIIVLSIIR